MGIGSLIIIAIFIGLVMWIGFWPALLSGIVLTIALRVWASACDSLDARKFNREIEEREKARAQK